ncbi:hypothetical protein RCCS2_11839 [Roseobacter sp. CCS2]|nr:hypothetical protein RCCS2_11839 [Roseobacter sp. CCS2]
MDSKSYDLCVEKSEKRVALAGASAGLVQARRVALLLGFCADTVYRPDMDRILISACLVGRPVRYNGTDKTTDAADIIARWGCEGRLVPLCPEIAVGFPTPRPPAEICGMDGGGADVLAGTAQVVEDIGRDVSALYIRAAHDTVAFAKRYECRHAVLTDGSPSCGSTFIYDGTFSGVTRPGMGATTAALRQANVHVWPETQIAALDALLRR